MAESVRRVVFLPGASGAGRFWQPDYFDRYLRGEDHFDAAINYIEKNPVEAGLVAQPEEWRFGSAWRRARGDVDEGRGGDGFW